MMWLIVAKNNPLVSFDVLHCLTIYHSHSHSINRRPWIYHLQIPEKISLSPALKRRRAMIKSRCDESENQLFALSQNSMCVCEKSLNLLGCAHQRGKWNTTYCLKHFETTRRIYPSNLVSFRNSDNDRCFRSSISTIYYIISTLW
jgi:hypothetical protein